MPRRTPILAFLLAPLALVLLLALWRHALVPMSRDLWYSDTLMQWRLDSSQPATRIAAARAVGSWGTEDPALLERVVARVETDDSVEVRKAAAGALGQLGGQQPLPADAVEALSTLVLTESDPALLSAAIAAVGRSAPHNRYADPVLERIAGILTEQPQAPWNPTAAKALGNLGAIQPLPDPVFEAMNAIFTDPDRARERQSLVSAFTEIAESQPLPVATLELLTEAFMDEPDPRIRRSLVYALSYSADNYPPAVDLITEATGDPDPTVVSAAENGLRIIEHRRSFGDNEPLSIAIDTSQPVEVRLDALRILRSSRIDPQAREPIAALAHDANPEIAVAALEMFRYLARAPKDDLDQRVLIPELTRAMNDPDAEIREAAYGALSMLSSHRPAYLEAGDFPARLEAGAQDPAPRVRVVAMVAMLRGANRQQRQALVERGLADPDPYVRANAVTWLGSPKTPRRQRQELFARALEDPDPSVRASAAATQKDWESRKRAWPVELWKLWQAGERRKVGLRMLTAVTVATPILICGLYLLYFVARLLTLVVQRRWRAAAVVPVLAAWAAASYGMFLLYFLAGHAGDVRGGELVALVAILWGAIAIYTALGWGLHFAVRR